MALLVITNGYLLLNASDLSDHVSKLEFNVEADELDSTTFGSTGYKAALGGLKQGTLGITFKQDFAAANVDAVMFPLVGTVATFDIKAVNAARSTSNPSYTGSVMVKEWKPISGSVGDLLEVDVSFNTSGAVTRATA